MSNEDSQAFAGDAYAVNCFNIVVSRDWVRIAFMEQGPGEQMEAQFRTAVVLSRSGIQGLSDLLGNVLAQAEIAESGQNPMIRN